MTSPSSTTTVNVGDVISYKVGFDRTVPVTEAERRAEAALNEYALEVGRKPVIETFEKVETDDHKEAGEYLMVIRGRWQ